MSAANRHIVKDQIIEFMSSDSYIKLNSFFVWDQKSSCLALTETLQQNEILWLKCQREKFDKLLAYLEVFGKISFTNLTVKHIQIITYDSV